MSGNAAPAAPPDKDAPPTPADVLAAYRWILGRAPENEDVAAAHLASAETREVLRRRFLASPEFLAAHGYAGGADRPAGPAPRIELQATEAQRARLLGESQRGWQRLGEIAPYWSALPGVALRSRGGGDGVRSVLATGREDRALLEAVLGRLGMAPGAFAHLADFGCGIGRATLHFAACCPEVTGLDFAPSQLAVARREAARRGFDHIAWMAVRPGMTMPPRPCDLWFSRRVLQHNPPPVIRALLADAFARLAPGAVAVFQLLTWGLGYGFDLGAALAAEGPDDHPLHVLPQAEVFALAAAAGLAVLAVHEDPMPGLDRARWLSHLFVMRRPV